MPLHLAQVPPVPKGKPRTEAERRVEWSYEATGPATGDVGGLWPWFRQGWPFLEEPDPGESSLVLRHLTSLAANLQPARFTILDQTGGHRLAELLRLEPRR